MTINTKNAETVERVEMAPVRAEPMTRLQAVLFAAAAALPMLVLALA